MSETEKRDIYVIGVHILFGIVIGASFNEFRSEIFLPKLNLVSFMFLASFSTIILSWIGYNNRIKEFGHRSAVLFAIDIIIVYFYYNLLFSVKNSFNNFLLGFVFIFVSYIVWDFVKSRKDKISFLKMGKGDFLKTLTEIISTLIFVGLWVLYGVVGQNLQYPYEQTTSTEIGLVVVIIVVIFFFRMFEPPFEKIWPQKK